MAGSEWTDKRPLSPHVQIWRWHATMAASIFHRVTGVGLYGGAFLITAWIVALGMGEGAYEAIEALIFSVPGQILLFLWAMAVLYHFANGLRHLIWDGPGAGFNPRQASAASIFNFAFAVFGAVGVWFAASLIGS